MAVRTRKELPFTRADVEALSQSMNEPRWLRELRLAAWEVFAATPMPTMRDEHWRRTDIRRFDWTGAGALRSANGAGLTSVPDEYLHVVAPGARGGLAALVDGRARALELAPAIAAQGVIFTDMITAVREHGELVRRRLLQTVPPTDGKFEALSGALWRAGLFLYAPPGVRVALPLHTLNWVNAAGVGIGRTLIVLGAGAEVTLLRESASPPLDADGLCVSAAEIVLGPGARLTYVNLQNLDEHWWAISRQRVTLARNASLDWTISTMGGRLVKTFMDVELEGRGASARLYGMFFSQGRQHFDHATQLNHRAPHSSSDLLFKGALRDRSRSVWRGNILVTPAAQKTDGFQANRNLLLSRQARADSIPGLEIEADDVRCSHASASGRMEEDQLFYMMARGVPRAEAERLIVEGFFEPIIARVPFEQARARLLATVRRKLTANAGG